MRITLIAAGVILVLAIGLGLLLFRNRGEGETNTNTNAGTGNTNTANVPSTNTGTNSDEPSDTPATVDDTTFLRTNAIIFIERFASYHENSRDAVLPSVMPYITAANYARLATDAKRIAALPDVFEPRTYTAHAVSATVVSKTDLRATLDVLLRVETYSGTPLTLVEANTSTTRLIMVKDHDIWKVENASF